MVTRAAYRILGGGGGGGMGQTGGWSKILGGQRITGVYSCTETGGRGWGVAMLCRVLYKQSYVQFKGDKGLVTMVLGIFFKL